jgi:hypothetical protein
MGTPTGHLPQRSANGILFRNSAHCGYLERLIIARSNIDHTEGRSSTMLIAEM